MHLITFKDLNERFDDETIFEKNYEEKSKD